MNVSRETSLQLASYERLLNTWSHRVNLVSQGDRSGDFYRRHLDDSLSLVEHLPRGQLRFIDLGSGGGLPAIPIAIVADIHADMVEADRRKAAFLQVAIATLKLRGTIWCERIETTCVAPSECITARALAPLERLLRLSERLLTPTGEALFLKGERAEEEIEHASRRWNMTVELLPGASKHSQIVRIRHLRRSLNDFG